MPTFMTIPDFDALKEADTMTGLCAIAAQYVASEERSNAYIDLAVLTGKMAAHAGVPPQPLALNPITCAASEASDDDWSMPLNPRRKA